MGCVSSTCTKLHICTYVYVFILYVFMYCAPLCPCTIVHHVHLHMLIRFHRCVSLDASVVLCTGNVCFARTECFHDRSLFPFRFVSSLFVCLDSAWLLDFIMRLNAFCSLVAERVDHRSIGACRSSIRIRLRERSPPSSEVPPW